MPQPIPRGMALGVISPEAAIAAFEKRGLLRESFHYLDLFQEEHARAFVVAGVPKGELLQAFHDEIERKFAEGGTLPEFRKTMRAELARRGWWGDVPIEDPATGEKRTTTFDNRRLKAIYETNVRQSYAAGRWESVQANKKRQPFLIYKTMDDGHVRAAHRPWHNLVLPVDHEFWQQHYPPNGWRCRCHAYAISQRGIERLQQDGQKLQLDAPPEQLQPYVNPRTGEVAVVARGVDPSFAYNPGQMRDAALYETLLRKAMDTPAYAGAVIVAQAQADHPAMLRQASARFGDWCDALVARRKALGEMEHIGAIAPAVLRELDRRGLAPQGAAISVLDSDALHALRSKKKTALPAALYRRLPELLVNARAVLLDKVKTPQALLYVIDLPVEDGAVGKLVVQLDRVVKVRREGRRGQVVLNKVRTATIMDPQALADPETYDRLWGGL